MIFWLILVPTFRGKPTDQPARLLRHQQGKDPSSASGARNILLNSLHQGHQKQVVEGDQVYYFIC